jgi:hypothetical protein
MKAISDILCGLNLASTLKPLCLEVGIIATVVDIEALIVP